MWKIKVKIKTLAQERDFFAKGVCLLLAVILWAFIASAKSERLTYKIPIVVKNIPQDLAVSGMSDKYATIVLEGRKDELKSVNIKMIRASIDLTNAEVKEPKNYRILVEKQQVPEDVTITLVEKEVAVTVEKKEDRWIRVLPNITGSVRNGKIIIDKMVVPERVKISGPRSVINDVDSIETEDVSVENEGGDIQRQVGLKKERFKDISFNEKIFTVKVLITDLKDLVVVTVPVNVHGGAAEYEYEARDRDVEIYIRSRNYRKVTPGDVEAFVDAVHLNLKGLFDKDPAVVLYRDLPVFVRARNVNAADIISIMPKKALVKIYKKQNQ
jgi:YbbR domain-containing protein